MVKSKMLLWFIYICLKVLVLNLLYLKFYFINYSTILLIFSWLKILINGLLGKKEIKILFF